MYLKRIYYSKAIDEHTIGTKNAKWHSYPTFYQFAFKKNNKEEEMAFKNNEKLKER